MSLLPAAYSSFVRHYRTLLAFGFLHAFLSSPGQTFFLALFVGSFTASFGIGIGELGAIYLAATLGAALLLPFVGHLIDRVDLRLFSGLAIAALGLSCLMLANSTSTLMLAFAILCLRFTGQGLMVHIDVTAIARYFGTERGKALSLTALGLPAAEAVMPLLAALLIGAVGWRATYGVVGLFIVLAALPLAQLLLAGRTDFTMPPYRRTEDRAPLLRHGLALLARSRMFWLALLALVYMPFTGTALVFHIEPIAATRGWSLDLVASSFVAHAVMHATALFASGPLVDRFTARRLLPLVSIPLVLGIVVLALLTHWIAPFLMLGLTGLTTGFGRTVFGALWAEVFGVRQLGAIRSAIVTLMVGGTAAGPAVLGYALDFGMPLTSALLVLAGAGVLASAIAAFDRVTPVRVGL